MKRISTICFLVIASIASTPFESFLPVLATRPCDHATRLLVSNSFDDQRTNRSPLLDFVKNVPGRFYLGDCRGTLSIFLYTIGHLH